MGVKVLHINYNYVGTALHNVMVQHLDPLVERNAVFAATWRDVDRQYSTEVKISKCFNKWDRAFFHIKQKKILNALEEVYNLSEFNLIHAYTLFTDGNCAYELYKKYGKPYIVAVRDTDVNSFFKYMIHLRARGIVIMKNASAIIFLSDAYKSFVLSKYVPSDLRSEIESKSRVIPNGIDDFWINNLGKPRTISNNRSIKVVFAGRINDRKNPLCTVEALKILKGRGYEVSFEVVGKKEDAKICEALTEEDFVRIFEACPKEELIKYYRRNDIFVMPSRTETFGLVYAEAMSQGLPVLYSSGQGFDGQFPDGFIGYAVDKSNPQNVAERIIDVITQYAKMSQNCVANIPKFDWNNIVIMYRDLYEHILRG